MTTFDKKIRISVGQSNIAGTLIAPGTLVPGVLFVHGWGGSQEQYAARAHATAALGCICLTFDMRGHAETRQRFESVSRETNLRDLQAAYDKLVAQPHVDRSSIAVVGSSYGGYLGAILTTKRKVRWLGLRAPALYRDEGWRSPKLQLHKEQDLHALRRRFVPAPENRALRACREFEGDVLLVESEHDTIVPHAVLASYREALANARSITSRCIDGADHGLSGERDQRAYTQILVGWLREMLTEARSAALPAQPAVEVETIPESPLPELAVGA